MGLNPINHYNPINAPPNQNPRSATGLNAGNQRAREEQKGAGVRERISMVNVDLSGTNEEERKVRFTYDFLRLISSLK
jgi:hypothetical protein